MTMDYIRKQYGVPAKRGIRVEANGEPGRIIGAQCAYLKIKLDTHNRPGLFHPTWHMVYYTDENTETFIGGRKL